MKIWKKITLGFISVILVMIIVDYNALRNNIDIINHVDDLELSKRVELNESNKIAYVVQRIKSNLRELFLEAKRENAQHEILRAEQGIAENTDKLFKSLIILQEATHVGYRLSKEQEDLDRDEEELIMIDSLKIMVNRFTLSLNQILRLQEEKRFNESEDLFEDDAEPVSREIQDLIEEIEKSAQEEVDWAIRQLDEKVDKAIQLGIYLTILSILLSMAIGFYISRSISNPLNKLILGTKEIGQGNLEASVNLKTKGELQKLADSFNNMAKELKIKITSINKLNKELEESNSTKDTFFSIIGHDLKTPFNSILGFTNLLETQYNDFNDEERKKMISEVNKSAVVIYELLENLLTWARSQSGKIRLVKENLKVAAIIEKSIESYAANVDQKRIRMINKVPDNLGVFADRFTLSVIFNNIINNAIKFTPNGGSITISAKTADRKVELSIKDTGVGMNQETINNLFHSEKTTSKLGTNNEVGTGLGLILIKEFIQKNGGRFRVSSELKKGTEFRFSLPAERKPY